MSHAGLIYGPEFHHLDHLAPLCALLRIPLILTEDALACQAKEFYPDLEILHWSPHETPDRAATNFSTIYYSTPRILFDQVFYLAQALQGKKIQTIWCPHGNSDKGRNSPFMEALAGEELLLTYGPRMEAFLKEKKIDVPVLRIGNYRLAYYEKHKAFYDNLLAKKLPPKSGKMLLYAPTWQDEEKNSSFIDLLPHLLEIPEEFFFLAKLHPNLYQQYPEEIAKLKKTIFVLEDFPPIYPLLARTDLYIGDMSSIGYDFLAFKRPMLLLNEQGSLKESGAFLASKDYPRIFEISKKLLREGPPENTLYEETFSPCSLENISILQGSQEQ